MIRMREISSWTLSKYSHHPQARDLFDPSILIYIDPYSLEALRSEQGYPPNNVPVAQDEEGAWILPLGKHPPLGAIFYSLQGVRIGTRYFPKGKLRARLLYNHRELHYAYGFWKGYGGKPLVALYDDKRHLYLLSSLQLFWSQALTLVHEKDFPRYASQSKGIPE